MPLFNIVNAGREVLNSDGPLDRDAATRIAAEIEADNPGTECSLVECPTKFTIRKIHHPCNTGCWQNNRCPREVVEIDAEFPAAESWETIEEAKRLLNEWYPDRRIIRN